MNGRNTLHYAADYGHVEVVKLLLEKAGKIDVSNIYIHVQSCIIYMCMYVYEVLCYTLFHLSSPRFVTGSSRRNGTRIL